eukprot:TRINITY_DN4067_c0_g1_i1.p1 TRINITY_DN4067_c0_g1~~TRINITY_DN4067_c0_g1_i1.p1  ORF type:complete len:128 (+),score=14.65 TRINITY_DN4067_c0_g1_i1:8-391(+)
MRLGYTILFTMLLNRIPFLFTQKRQTLNRRNHRYYTSNNSKSIPLVFWKNESIKESPKEIQKILTEKLNPKSLNVTDKGGCGTNIVIDVVSDQFDGLSLLEQHKLVCSLIKDQLEHVHALTIHSSVE